MTTVTQTTTFEYDEAGRLIREITTTVTWIAPPAPPVKPTPYVSPYVSPDVYPNTYPANLPSLTITCEAGK